MSTSDIRFGRYHAYFNVSRLSKAFRRSCSLQFSSERTKNDTAVKGLGVSNKSFWISAVNSEQRTSGQRMGEARVRSNHCHAPRQKHGSDAERKSAKVETV